MALPKSGAFCATDAAEATVLPDWLAVSTEGFAGMNAGRDPAHLVKEQVQNALDALGGQEQGGHVTLDCRPAGADADRHDDQGVVITCCDDGCGMLNLQDIRTVFYTSKTDSHRQRGRMGRGFKEMLCLAEWAAVTSGRGKVIFCVEDGRKVTKLERVARAVDAVRGTLVQMRMPWKPEVISRLEAYFATLLPPAGVTFTVNGITVEARAPAQVLEATLPTELFDAGRWVRPSRSTTVELVPVVGDEEPSVYEMGIPVCPAEWTQPFHVNVMQRVPMNPCRDAVASGYLTRLHRACLPALLPQMSDEQVRQDWVGNAVPQCDEAVQREVIRRGFGENLARSVPKMGVRQYDEDAREIGVEVIDTKRTSGGFRQVLQQHLPTTKDAVDQHNRALRVAAAAGSFHPDTVFASKRPDDVNAERRALIEAAGGRERVGQVLDFARWFCQQLLDGYEEAAVCSVQLALLLPVDAVATWSEGDVLTLGIDTPWLWSEPLGERSLGVYVHEVSHHLNAHHGRDFHSEVERLAGRAARVMLLGSQMLRGRFPQFFA